MLSDHIPVELSIHDVSHDTHLGSLRQTAVLLCPSGVDRSLERALLHSWNSNDDVRQFHSCLDTNPVVSVQEEWDTFQHLLLRCCLDAYDCLSHVGFLERGVREECASLAQQRPFKGAMAEYVVKSAAQVGIKHRVGNLRLRKLRRTLARCYQFKRLMCRDVASLTRDQSLELHRLHHKLQQSWPRTLTLREVLCRIDRLKHEVRQLEGDSQRRAISKWRHELITSDAALSRWLKSKTTPVGVMVIGSDGLVADTDVSAAQAIHTFWTNFWTDVDTNQPSLARRVASLIAGLDPVAACSWCAPSGVQLRNVALFGSRGSAGPDGWSAVEIGALPGPVFDLFALLGQRWLLAGAVPRQLNESRMVSLPKAGKVSAEQTIAVEHLRPITILSCWWRIWSGALIRFAVRPWLRDHVPEQFAVAHNHSTGDVIVDLLEYFFSQRGGYLMTLDYSKALTIWIRWPLGSSLCTWGGLWKLCVFLWLSGRIKSVGFPFRVTPLGKLFLVLQCRRGTRWATW